MKLFLLVASLLVAACLTHAFCQSNFNEREVKSDVSALDKADVWALDFRFKDPRLIKVNYPGRGTRIFWYMWYQVINRTGKPQEFGPTFELVTLDNPGVYVDEVLPAVVEAIKRIEDPTGYQDIKNSVTISGLVPASKPADQAFPKAVTGVTVWDSVACQLEEAHWNSGQEGPHGLHPFLLIRARTFERIRHGRSDCSGTAAGHPLQNIAAQLPPPGGPLVHGLARY